MATKRPRKAEEADISGETPILDGKYILIGKKPEGVISIGIGKFDLSTLTEKEAQRLVDSKVKWIKVA